jgi:hypothetical protein
MAMDDLIALDRCDARIDEAEYVHPQVTDDMILIERRWREFLVAIRVITPAEQASIDPFKERPPMNRLQAFFRYYVRTTEGMLDIRPGVKRLKTIWITLRRIIRLRANYSYTHKELSFMQSVSDRPPSSIDQLLINLSSLRKPSSTKKGLRRR